MNRVTILSATIAAGVHVAVLGYKASPPVDLPHTDEAPPDTPTWILPVIPDEPEDPPLDPQPSDDLPQPPEPMTCSVGAELPAIESFADFQIIRPPSPEIKIPDVDRIDPRGIPNGTSESVTWVLKTQLDNVPRALFRTSPNRPPGTGFDEETVTVDFIVGKDGTVSTARVIDSSNSLLEDACLRAVKRWRFEPGMRKNVPVAFRMQQTFVFTINN